MVNSDSIKEFQINNETATFQSSWLKVVKLIQTRVYCFLTNDYPIFLLVQERLN
jgi:hypothetical protein